jgi:hypothetical protein
MLILAPSLSVAITDYHRLGNLGRIEVYLAQVQEAGKSKSMVIASGKSLPATSQLGRGHHKGKTANMLAQVSPYKTTNAIMGAPPS